MPGFDTDEPELGIGNLRGNPPEAIQKFKTLFPTTYSYGSGSFYQYLIQIHYLNPTMKQQVKILMIMFQGKLIT